MTIYTAHLETKDGRLVREEFSGYTSEDALADIARYCGAIYPGVDSCVVDLPSGEQVILGLKRRIEDDD